MRDDHLKLLGRDKPLFAEDICSFSRDLAERVQSGRFLVVGGGGSIGGAVVKELFKRNPRTLHVVDANENNLVEVVRDVRSSLGYIEGDFRTFALDALGQEFGAFLREFLPYDYVLNFAAMKHVRSERDKFTLMRMIKTNVLMSEEIINRLVRGDSQKYFCVSTDKAVNPANAMGATKRIMELCLALRSGEIHVSSARFANVAFSDGGLLHSFGVRLAKRQPISAPEDVLRYFITAREAANLCMMACLLGRNLDCFFPAPEEGLEAVSFRLLAELFLDSRGYRPHPCESEEEARSRVEELALQGKWPCYFFRSDTTGEKMKEEFYGEGEEVLFDLFSDVGVVRWSPPESAEVLHAFLERVIEWSRSGCWRRADILGAIEELVPTFRHRETGRFLDDRM